MHAEMHAALLRARHPEALGSRGGERPDALHLERDLGMELEAERVLAAAKALHRIGVVGRQQLAARGQLHALAMPLIHFHRPRKPRAAGFGRLDADVADLDLSLRMRPDLAAG